MKVSLSALLFPALTVAVAACGGDDGDCAEPITDGTGTWTITEVVDGSDCDEGTYTENYTVSVTQSGNSLTVVAPTGTFSGEICGNKVSWSGSYPEDGGTTTATIDLTVSADGNSLNGSVTWSWTDGSDSCAGTSQTTGSRQ